MPISTGISALDDLMGGGLLERELTLLYGEAGSGKSGFMIQLACSSAIHGWKTIFIQSDGRFPSERLKQIAGPEWKEVVEHTPILEVEEFEQQEDLSESLSRYLTPGVKLVLWDTFTSLYRLAQSTSKQNVLLSKSLNRQLAILLELARKKNLAIVLAAQMRGVIHTTDSNGESEWETEGPVAETVLDYWTGIRLKLQKTPQSNHRRLTLERHPSIETPRSLLLSISERGLEAAGGSL